MLRVVCCLIVAVRCVLSVMRGVSMCVNCCLSVVNCGSLSMMRCVLFAVCWLLFAVCCFRCLSWVVCRPRLLSVGC